MSSILLFVYKGKNSKNNKLLLNNKLKKLSNKGKLIKKFTKIKNQAFWTQLNKLKLKLKESRFNMKKSQGVCNLRWTN